MEMSGQRVRDHLIAWSAAVFLAALVFYRKSGYEISVGPIEWYTPVLWLLVAALFMLACVAIAFVPAAITSYITESYQAWKKPTKVIFFIGIFLVALVCSVFLIKVPALI